MVKKKKVVSFSKIKEITRVDEKSFYVPSSDPEKEPYLVFNSVNKGWLCDCLAFVVNIEDNGNTKRCKHINRIIQEFKLE